MTPHISAGEFERLPLRVHDFLAGVPLHDVWAVDLPHARSGITLDEFLRTAKARACIPSPIVRALLNIIFFIGQLLGRDREPSPSAWNLSKPGLTTADRSKSLVPVCTREGLFRVVYRFENEQLLELINRTAHAFHLAEPFRRRLRCSSLLQQVPKDSIRDRPPPRTAQQCEDFRICLGCDLKEMRSSHT